MGSLREKILSLDDLHKQTVKIPEWGVTLEVRTIDAGQRARLLMDVMDEKGRPDLEKMQPAMVIAACFDPETGERVFEEADSEVLNHKNGAVIDRLVQVAMKLSGMHEGAEKAAEKN